MRNQTARGMRASGFTLVEVIITAVVLSVFGFSILTALSGSQRAVMADQVLANLQTRAQHALERIVEEASQAVSTDPLYSPLSTTSGVASHCLRFRQLQSVDTSGNPVYDDTLRRFIYGGKTSDCLGLVILSGPDLATIRTKSAGPDQRFGTADDSASYTFGGGIPAVELLIRGTLAPRIGNMLAIDVQPAPVGRFITFTLRLNARGAQGQFLLGNDLVLTQSVALRQ